MKRPLIIFLILVSVQFIHGQSLDARRYLDNTYGPVNSLTYYFNQIANSENKTDAFMWVDSLKKQSTKCLQNINKLKVYDNNTEIKANCTYYIKHLNSISKKEIPQLYLFKFNNSYSEKNKADLDRLVPTIHKMTILLYKAVKTETEKYKEKYRLFEPSEYNLSYEEKTSIDSASKYNDYIVDRVDMADELWTLAIEEEAMNYALAWSDLLTKYADKAIKSLEKLTTHNRDPGFKEACIKYLKHFSSIGKNELPEFIRIIRTDEMTVEGEKRAEELIPILDDIREGLFDALELKQMEFSDSANFVIIGNSGQNDSLKYNYTEISSFDNPEGYNDYIVNMVDIIDHYWTKAIEEENMEKALSLCDSLNFYSSKAISTLSKLGSFQGYDLFRTTSIDYAAHMKNISGNELIEFIKIIRAKKMNNKQEKRAESLIPVLDDERERLYNLIEKAQNEYATKFNIVIVK